MNATPSLTEVDPQFLPQDSIQSMVFNPDPAKPVLAICSWDGSICLFEVKDVESNSYLTASKKIACIPLFSVNIGFAVLELKWMPSQQDALCITAGNGGLYLLQPATQQLVKILETESLLFGTLIQADGVSVIVTISSNRYLKYWAVTDTSKPIKNLELRHSPLCADNNQNALIMGLSNNYVGFVKFSSPENICYLSLNLDIIANCIAFSTQYDFVIGTVDGRLLVGEVVISNENRTLNRKIAFKAHKKEERFEKKSLYMVNSVGFTDEKRQNSTDLVYSCGHEGSFKLWDLRKRETIFDLSFSEKRKTISCCAVSPDRKYVAIAFGYDWSSGVWGLKEDTTPVSLGLQYINLP